MTRPRLLCVDVDAVRNELDELRADQTAANFLAGIEATARDQLYGTISQTWDAAGLTVEFTVPIGDLFRQT